MSKTDRMAELVGDYISRNIGRVQRWNVCAPNSNNALRLAIERPSE